MSVNRVHGGIGNQAGMTAPFVSAWGQALLAGQSKLIDQPAPIGSQSMGFGGTVGGVVTLAASVTPIQSFAGYFGDLPQSEQDSVDAPAPWDRT